MKTKTLSDQRKHFPSLSRTVNGSAVAYFDGPAGSQMPQQVIDAISSYYATSNANTHGSFLTSRETDTLLEETREAVASFVGAPHRRTISFGANMTTLNFSLSKAIARSLQEGEEILITQLDHEANRAPWLALRENGIVVREILLKQNGTLDYEDARRKITERTRLVAMGLASNALGTVNDVALIRELTHKVGAWLMVDAVHFAPHFSVDVTSLDVDFLICSAYKFYGPHVGLLYCRDGLLDQLQTDRLRTQDPRAPQRIETGTLNHAAIAGVKGAIEYLAGLGTGKDLRSKLVSALNVIHEHEEKLGYRIHAGLRKLNGITVYGPAYGKGLRAPTVSFTIDTLPANQVCDALARRGIFAWDGHFYAVRAVEILGLGAKGGLTRVGILLYNTSDEVERLLGGVKEIAKRR
jgi:cysteine desulfurase family protein (TIGR01976 family)